MVPISSSSFRNSNAFLLDRFSLVKRYTISDAWFSLVSIHHIVKSIGFFISTCTSFTIVCLSLFAIPFFVADDINSCADLDESVKNIHRLALS
jgi:hypothetical protein